MTNILKNKILIIAAHPDDETYGVGGTIARYSEEDNIVDVLILTDGVTARHKETDLQRNAANEAIKILGVNELHFSGLPDQRLDGMPLLEVINPIYKLIKKLKPDIVFTHNGKDVNQDHRIVFNATMVAVRPFGDNTVKQVYTYEVPSSTEWAPPLNDWLFLPSYYVNIEKYFDIKLKAIECYTKTHISEVPPFPHPRSVEAIKIHNQKRGIEVGLNYAEAFSLIRSIIR